jgi:hypothetical protein
MHRGNLPNLVAKHNCQPVALGPLYELHKPDTLLHHTITFIITTITITTITTTTTAITVAIPPPAVSEGSRD